MKKRIAPEQSSPPRFATRFLRWYCRADLLDEVEGDLYELFQRRLEQQSVWKARLLYCLNVLMFVHPDYIRKRKQYYPTNSTVMFRNYFKVATRNLIKHKFYTLLNVLGLAIGMLCCLFIFLYVQHELSYDRFHAHQDRIYRLVTDIKTPTETLRIGATSAPMAAYMKKDFPEVEEMVRMDDASFLMQVGDQKFQEDDVMLADSTFFSVFSFKVLEGNPRTALKAPFSIVLTEDGAKKYFGNEDPLGKHIMLEGEYDCQVTAVMENVPENSHFTFDILVSLSTRLEAVYPQSAEQWGNFSAISYVKLAEQADPETLESKLPGFLDNYISEENRKDAMNYTLYLEPLSQVYFSDRGGFSSGNLTNVKIFSVIAIFILLIACINFMNLATARATERAKEVGIRKVVGALRQQVTIQFLCESVLLSLMAFIIALLVGELLLPAFNQLAGKTVALSVIQHIYYIPLFIGLVITIGLLAGAYPAVVLSGFRSVTILKGRFSSSHRGVWLRKALVVAQFAISIILIAGTAVVYIQLDYMRNQALGFKKDQVMVIDFRGDQTIQQKIETFKQQLGAHPEVKSVTASSSVPSKGMNGAFTEIENPEGDLQSSNVNLFYVDHDFLPQLEMPVVAGRAFSRDFATDSTALIVNEALSRSYGYASPKEIIGKRFSQWGVEGEIIGVVKDYHFRSLQEEIDPLTIRLQPEYSRYFSLNLSADNITETVAALEQQWKELAPERPFNYSFLDEAFNQQYRTEVRFGQLFSCFAILAICIACLGLLGLISYTLFQRTKEIGIRKVLGATEKSLVMLLSKDFMLLVMLAFLVAAPIAWYTLSKWLEGFAYRVAIPWWAFVAAGLLTALIAMLTVSFQSIKAAIANPIDSLRNE